MNVCIFIWAPKWLDYLYMAIDISTNRTEPGRIASGLQTTINSLSYISTNK